MLRSLRRFVVVDSGNGMVREHGDALFTRGMVPSISLYFIRQCASYSTAKKGKQSAAPGCPLWDCEIPAPSSAVRQSTHLRVNPIQSHIFAKYLQTAVPRGTLLDNSAARRRGPPVTHVAGDASSLVDRRWLDWRIIDVYCELHARRQELHMVVLLVLATIVVSVCRICIFSLCRLAFAQNFCIA